MPEQRQPIVILGTGRSFTSVICCMIGQHPELIGLPETNIFVDPTLGEVYDRFSQGANALRRAGLLRVLAHFHDGVQTDETIDEAEVFWLENEHWTSREIGEYLFKLIGPRGIVEKSISSCRDAETLARVREAWPDAWYIHITRQPESIVHSMKSRIDGAMEKGKIKRLKRLMERDALKSKTLEDYYNRYTTTILEFMATLPPGKGMNLNGEDFLSDARLYCRQICEWIGLDASDAAIEAMMHPEDNPFANLGPKKAPRGMSASFIENPTYSGEKLTVKPLSIQASDPTLDMDHRNMVILGNRLGYL